MATVYDKIYDVLCELDDSDIVDMWNETQERNRYGDDVVHFMDEFDDEFRHYSIREFLEEAERDFDINDDYFRHGSYIDSFSDLYDVVDLEELTNYIIDSEDSLGNTDIREILEEGDDDEEEEG